MHVLTQVEEAEEYDRGSQSVFDISLLMATRPGGLFAALRFAAQG